MGSAFRLSRFVFCVGPGILPVLMGASLTIAAQVKQYDEQSIVREAATIFHGSVISAETAWSADQTQIYTTVEFAVHEYYKGWSPEISYTLTYLGGTVGDITLLVSGQPDFAVGEEAILFIEAQGQSYIPLVGMKQGKLTIEIDETTGEKRVVERDLNLTDVRFQILAEAAQQRIEMEPEIQRIEAESGRKVLRLDEEHIASLDEGDEQ